MTSRRADLARVRHREVRRSLSEESRFARAWLTVIGRAPAPEEVTAAKDYLARFPGRPGNDEGRQTAWASLCRTLIASNDFIYIH